ncbi:MAG: hypothetical protein KC994_14060 [Candidatus Omnitrophica bacterium]|nr:hypothetical protein [Candidatus Omnitrophota bacterium]
MNSPRIIATLILLTAPFLTLHCGAIEHNRGTGEPYALSGNRLAFHNWYYIRPGQLDWQNSEGKSVYSSGAEKAGRFESKFHYYDYPHGIRIVAHPAEKTGPVIEREKPWEEMGIRVSSLLHEEGVYRMWGTSQSAKGVDYGCYFESTDGLHWIRPNLGIVDYAGDTDTNLLEFDKPVSIFKDPTAQPEERYKTVWHGDFEPEQFEEYKRDHPWSVMATETDPGRFHSIRAAVSPDGLRWETLPRPLSVEPSDTNVVCTYDSTLKKYVMYTRNYMIGPRAVGFPNPTERMHQFVFRRAIGRTESDSFYEFPLSQVIVEPGPEKLPTDTFYTSCKTTLPGAPDHHLMFPAIYHQSDDTTSIEIQASYDGKLWHRIPGSPILEPGPEGAWDGGCVFTTHNLAELPNGDFALPYTGYLYPHKYPRGAWGYDIGMAIWPKGRMIGLEAEDEGEFATMAIVLPGSKMGINALTKRAGQILVEVADYNGDPITGHTFEEADPIVGDQFGTTITWKGESDLGVEKGTPVILRFRMKMAEIFYLDFE